MKIHKATYLISSPNYDQCLVLQAPEYAFIGRSNVGKSSIINAICGQKGLAKTSSAPGKTQLIAGLEHGYTIFLTADHGNADYMMNEDGSPNTAHSLNLVPFFIIDKNWKGPIQSGKLGDLAPTILHMMELPIPKEMTGKVLIQY